MKRTVAWLTAAAVSVPASAHASGWFDDFCKGNGPRNAISVRPLSFAARSFAAQYERFVLPPRLSLVGGLGIRGAALGDYSSVTYDVAAEARVWIAGHKPWVPCGRGVMAGPYLALRADAAYTRLYDHVAERHVGSQMSYGQILAGGYRGVLWNFFELTPSAGVALITETDPRGRLAAYPRFTLVFSLTAGWMF
ncbi:MAG: hypothetical protein HY898_14245 [Deltaproteobacteria bacterium]|nr:hypothetical protein [Deltaproteobacteria bacterium]